MSTKLNEIKLDIEELNLLLQKACRQKSKDVLSFEIRNLQTQLINIQNQSSTAQENKIVKTTNTTSKCYEVKLNNYAWDQTDDFIKLYVTLNNVQTIPKEDVVCNFSDNSMDLNILRLGNKNYKLTINNLCESIDSKKSYIKIKSDMIIVYLAKKSKVTWSCVTRIEKMLNESKANKYDINDADNSSTGIMNLMTKMYNEGNDEMKKTIAKAWTESQEKMSVREGLDSSKYVH